MTINRKAYAAALADIIEIKNTQHTPYNDGKFLIKTNSFSHIEAIQKEDFILGAKAALSLTPKLLTDKQCNDIMNKFYNAMMEKYQDLLNKIQ